MGHKHCCPSTACSTAIVSAGIGLAASLITLATVFKACVDSFELYKAAENCEESLKTVLVELDCEKERLLIWAEAIGLVQLESGKRHPDIEKHEKVIQAVLEQIRSLFDDATKLQERYGIKVFDDSNAITTATTHPMSKNLATMFKIAYKRFTSRLNSADGNTPNVTMKIRWAIRDRAKFTELIVTLKGFVDRLFPIIPISREVQDSMIKADIFSIMNLSQLQLVEAACEGSYQVWSDASSDAIRTVERETIDQHTHKDDQEQDSRTPFQLSQANAGATVSELICQDGWWFKAAQGCLKLFAAVERCNSSVEPLPCNDREFHLLSTKYPCYLAERFDRWDLGRRLVAEIDLSLFTSTNINDLLKTDEDDEINVLTNVRIYVAPCKRQISAAISICMAVSSVRLLDCYVRIDDRLSASCCSTSAISERLKSILSELKEGNYSGIYDQKQVECIDRLFLEHRLYEIDGEIDRDPMTLETQPLNHLRNVYDLTHLTKPLAAILLIGESNLINKVMNTKPFQASPRVPQPNEFFSQFRVGFNYERKFLGSIHMDSSHKVQAPAAPISSPASQLSLKRGPETGLGVNGHVKRANTQSEPESEDMYN